MVSKLNNEKTALCSIRVDPAGDLECTESSTESCTLVVAKPIRQSLRNWSGCEDVMKVALEMAKHVCQSQVFSNPGYRLEIPDVQSFKRIIRFRLMVYVPGVLWKADTSLDYILTEDLDLPNLYRDLLKIYHLCSEVNGTIIRHEDLTEEASTEISNVLCGPLAAIPDKILPDGRTITLNNLLVNLRNLFPDDVKAYALDQSLLLPTVQLATMYESFTDDCGNLSSRIQKMQDGHTDHLALSAGKYLSTLEAVFDKNKVWLHFMRPKLPQELSGALRPRDEISGLYGKPAGRKGTKRQQQKESNWLQEMAFRDRPGNPGQ